MNSRTGNRVIEWMEFTRRREGMIYALDGGLWFHRHILRGEPMAHLVSSDQELLLHAGSLLELRRSWLQYKPLKYPPTGERREAWHWDLRGLFLERAVVLAAGKR
jgi:hypothetical protein